MSWIEVISVGPGDAALLTIAARQALNQAQAVCCAQRHRALLPPGVNVIPMLPLEEALDALAAQREAGLRTAVLVSGDAGVYSLLNLLAQRFGRDVLRVHPGVSALQAFFAAMKRPWQEAHVLSAHGRALSPSALCHAVRTGRETVLFLDEARDPHWVREVLTRGGLEPVRITVGERLSYADERVADYEPGRAYPLLCMALVENDAPSSGLPPIGLADECFCRGKTPMTKREIRVQVLSALGLAPDSVVWDVGAGTGSVTVECARQCPLGEVFA
ncbi:MAG: precorrin-6y C5,15-methyltransferase (decarboxylating) subunit CbiE, partial [Candidatus Ventricola sp.]